MCRQFTAVLCIVACNMGNNCQLAADLFHDSFQYSLTFFNALINAFAGRTAYIKTFDALAL